MPLLFFFLIGKDLQNVYHKKIKFNDFDFIKTIEKKKHITCFHRNRVN